MKVPRSAISEADVKKIVLDYCAIKGLFVERRNVGAFNAGKRYIKFAKAGMSDLWGIYKGRHWECELKRPGEEPSQDQRDWLDSVTQAGGHAFWADSLEMFIKGMERL